MTQCPPHTVDGRVGGKPGWFYLFALMGAFTVLCGCILGLCLPDSVQNPRSTFLPFRRIFTDRELHILKTRVLLDDPQKAFKKKYIPIAAFKQAFTNWRLYIHFLITMCNNGPQRGFDTYAPSLGMLRDFTWRLCARSNRMQ